MVVLEAGFLAPGLCGLKGDTIAGSIQGLMELVYMICVLLSYCYSTYRVQGLLTPPSPSLCLSPVTNLSYLLCSHTLHLPFSQDVASEFVDLLVKSLFLLYSSCLGKYDLIMNVESGGYPYCKATDQPMFFPSDSSVSSLEPTQYR
jgi:hypothetical protein